ncbi:hypothetical protein Vadar_026015 [Vaccinium darrowii]|uniref:Uncharacterized protein n=1 Tax=Vaccinium darrowii TaxID=229202 RepID=A0ACB7ZLL6_9ERIC|nr:hypothetical protein Vadar_026015 [Vaccinium darrowii]
MGAKSWPLSSKDGKKLHKDILGDAESSEICGAGEVRLPGGERNLEETIESSLDLLELKNEVFKLVRCFHASKETRLLLDQMLWPDPILECIIQIVEKVEQNMVVKTAYAEDIVSGSGEGSRLSSGITLNYIVVQPITLLFVIEAKFYLKLSYLLNEHEKPVYGERGAAISSNLDSHLFLGIMESRIPPGSYFQYSPRGVHHGSLQRSSSLPLDHERYLAELYMERQKLGPFMQILPICSRLINQEIMRMSGLISNQSIVDHERIGHGHPFRSLGQQANGGPVDVQGWSAMQTEENGHLQRMTPFHASHIGWHGARGIPTSPPEKRVVRLDVPVDKFPDYNFVGRLLGPRGNSLKRFEAMTECRVYIRGRGSVKDSIKEEKLKDKPGYEHLNEPLHLLVEAEFPEDVIASRLDHAVAILENLLKPVDESMDQYKKEQLKELARINGTLREESARMLHETPLGGQKLWEWLVQLMVLLWQYLVSGIADRKVVHDFQLI